MWPIGKYKTKAELEEDTMRKPFSLKQTSNASRYKSLQGLKDAYAANDLEATGRKVPTSAVDFRRVSQTFSRTNDGTIYEDPS